ncbi:MAG: hypothetical protein JXB62_07740 [Pirellulales bacterium]|nr:hypothetical protein [Pirellulales bacterium]
MSTRRCTAASLGCALLGWLMVAFSCPGTQADDVLLRIGGAPDHGLVVCRVDLTGAARFCRLGPVAPGSLRAERLPDGAAVPVQFVPGPEYDPENRVAGTLILKLPSGGDARLRLVIDPAGAASPQLAAGPPFDGKVTTRFYRATHDAAKMGGLPCRFEFVESGKVFERFRWNDRLYDRESGVFALADDPEPRLELLSSGPLATVVRTRARYVQPGRRPPDARPQATYDWCYLNDLPLVWVTATAARQPGKAWSEAHFLELNFPGGDFAGWAGGEPPAQGKFAAETKSFHFDQWGALVDGRHAIAMLDCGQALFYDHRGGSYLQAHGDRAWQSWDEPLRQWSAWLWIGTDDDVVQTVRRARAALPTEARADVAVASVDARIEAARRQWQALQGPARRQTWWHAAAAAQLAAEGRFQEAMQTSEGRTPDGWTILGAGELGMVLARNDQGISLLSLFDVAADRPLLCGRSEPLFELSLRHVETGELVRLTADAGWRGVEVVSPEHDSTVELRWSGPADERLGAVEVVARATPEDDTSSVAWQLTATSSGNAWALWRVVFPQLGLGEPGPDSRLFLPYAAGRVEEGAWRRAFRSGGRYPSGWTSMQYMAAYAADRSTGVYLAVHDPFGGTKQIHAKGRPDQRQVVLAFDHPVPGMGTSGNRFELSGQAVWRLFRGDWFDAAVIYRQWVRQHAKWYPQCTADGRGDTPLWMRELAVWAMGGGDPKSGLPVLQEFADRMGLPVGFHWYRWHQIPFDNDYPHYFPADEGFADTVKLLGQKNVYVMPYINGRLWDIRDKGAEDFQFSKLALAAATKDDGGKPYVETYGSKEADGSKVELAVMCPGAPLWQDTVRQIVRRLFRECGVRGVYIDQVAAAEPQLCFDASHGHLPGGGHWWTESYWKMLDQIRREMPDDRILTTECNAEPYVKWFDGYLTWHWQYDGQVPAFPAVYGGSLQMFGRAYRGGPTKDLALRMKAGQQLVFGEQIGWIDPGVVKEKENFAFLRRLVHLRWRFRRYFYAGQMARPPKLLGEIPEVTADWQWQGVWPVTTSGVLSGAWQLPDRQRALLLLVNVSDRPIATAVELDAEDYGIVGDQMRLLAVGDEGEEEATTVGRRLRRDVALPPGAAVAWELTPP